MSSHEQKIGIGLVFSLLAASSVVLADSTPNAERTYTLTAINGFDLDAVRKCQREKGRLYISQYASHEVTENANWICVTGNLVYPLVGESIVLVDYHPQKGKADVEP